MLIVTGLVFCLALFFSLAYLTKLSQFVLSVALAREGSLHFMQMLVPSFLWALFYILVNWH